MKLWADGRLGSSADHKLFFWRLVFFLSTFADVVKLMFPKLSVLLFRRRLTKHDCTHTRYTQVVCTILHIRKQTCDLLKRVYVVYQITFSLHKVYIEMVSSLWVLCLAKWQIVF